jgi:hypothetical protein
MYHAVAGINCGLKTPIEHSELLSCIQRIQPLFLLQLIKPASHVLDVGRKRLRDEIGIAIKYKQTLTNSINPIFSDLKSVSDLQLAYTGQHSYKSR